MNSKEITDCLASNPVIAAVPNSMLNEALKSPAKIIFNLKISLLEIENSIKKVHSYGKKIFIHIDLAEGIRKDRAGVERIYTAGEKEYEIGITRKSGVPINESIQKEISQIRDELGLTKYIFQWEKQ